MFCFVLSSGCGDIGKEKSDEEALTDSIEANTSGNVVHVDMTRDPKNLSFARVKGYRVQIFTGSNRDEAIKVKGAFIQHFPDVDNYLEYEVPNYKVRVGDCLSKWQAKEFSAKIDKIPVFSGCFIVPSLVNAVLPKPEQDTVDDADLVYYTLIDSTGKEVQIPVLKSSLSKVEIDSIAKMKARALQPKSTAVLKEVPMKPVSVTPPTEEKK